MSARARAFLILVVVAVLLYFVIAQPTNAAATVRSIVAALGSALDSIITFFRSLF